MKMKAWLLDSREIKIIKFKNIIGNNEKQLPSNCKILIKWSGYLKKLLKTYTRHYKILIGLDLVKIHVWKLKPPHKGNLGHREV